MDSLFADLRHTLRRLRKSPVFSLISVATLALGIGANTALFAIVDAVLLRPLPYGDADRVVMVSHRLWQRRFGGDPSIIGRTMLMNDARYEIVAVLPEAFVFRTRTSDYWVPINFTPAQAAERRSHFLQVVARLKPGVTLEAA